MPSLTGMLRLNEDVILTPVSDLSPESQAQIECEAGDFAICRLRSRSGSKIIDPQAADLLSRFREAHTIVESVLLFGREKGLDPNKVLEDAYPLFRSLVAEGILVPAAQAAEPGPNGARFTAGDPLLGGRVTRTLQVLDDTELYLLSRPDRLRSVIKIERVAPSQAADGPCRERFKREIDFLSYLNGQHAPRLIAHGLLENRIYLEMEFLHGTDAMTAALEWRERKDHLQGQRLHGLVCSIVDAYRNLHDRGVLHGDIHPRNLVVSRHGEITLIDFGLSRCLDPGLGLPLEADRGGLPFFFDPQLAQSYLEGSPAQPATPASEQYALAAMLYFLITGHHWQDLRLGREEMLKDIVGREPLRFSERGVAPWPEIEQVLRRALSKSPEKRFSSTISFAEAVRNAAPDSDRPAVAVASIGSALDEALQRTIELVGMNGSLLRDGLTLEPTSSITYGSAGIALGTLQIAQRLNNPHLLAAADIWSHRALRDLGKAGAFYNRDIEITPEVVGEASPYHTASGVHAVATLVGCAMANPAAQAAGISNYLETVRRPTAGLDLTLGNASTILGSAILLDALCASPQLDASALRSFGNEAVTKLWKSLDAKPPITEAGVEYLGIAHGWAGFIYATLQWCRVSGSPIPEGAKQRLQELGDLALPNGRGVEWPWLLRERGEPQTMAGWCNGTCGYVFLWSIAHAMFGEAEYLSLAEEAAWNSWESPDNIATLCCGLVGRVYALLNLYRHTRDREWLDRARALASRTAREGRFPPEYPFSLYKGEFALAVLAADLVQPEYATMPFFEPIGYYELK